MKFWKPCFPSLRAIFLRMFSMMCQMHQRCLVPNNSVRTALAQAGSASVIKTLGALGVCLSHWVTCHS